MIYVVDGWSSQGEWITMREGFPYAWDIMTGATPETYGDTLSQMVWWCREYVGEMKTDWDAGGGYFWFAREIDACAFKVRFG